MKVNVELSKEYVPPHAVIYTDAVTDEIQKAIDLLGTNESPIVAQHEDRFEVIRSDDVYMVRVENGETVIYTHDVKFYSRKRLYEVLGQLGADFMQISKQCIIRLSRVKSVEAGFSGTLLLKLTNGLSDYVSRTYLPEFKKYLGL